MTSKEFIDNIISTRGKWSIPTDENGNKLGYEIHHIKPLCMGGEGDYKNGKFKKNSKHYNCIYLSYEEHYTVHKLLALDYPNLKGLQFAWWRMHCNGNDYISQEEFITLRDNVIRFISNRKLSDSTKEKMRLNHYDCSGENNPMYNRNHTNDSRLKMSMSSKGQIPWMKGKKHSEYSKELLKKSHPGVKIICIETDTVYESINDASRKTGIGICSIRNCLKVRSKTSGGYHWEKV